MIPQSKLVKKTILQARKNLSVGFETLYTSYETQLQNTQEGGGIPKFCYLPSIFAIFSAVSGLVLSGKFLVRSTALNLWLNGNLGIFAYITKQSTKNVTFCETTIGDKWNFSKLLQAHQLQLEPPRQGNGSSLVDISKLITNSTFSTSSFSEPSRHTLFK